MKKKIVGVIMLSFIYCCLLGCGQAGRLYLPDQIPPGEHSVS